jgi:hypothetical protein
MLLNRFSRWYQAHQVGWSTGTALLWLAIAVIQIVAIAEGGGNSGLQLIVLILAVVNCAISVVRAVLAHRKARRSADEVGAA